MALVTSEYRYFFNNIDFGIDVEKRRRELTVSQRELAVKVGYESSSAIANIEVGKGENSISMRRFLAICAYMDLDPRAYFEIAPKGLADDYNSR